MESKKPTEQEKEFAKKIRELRKNLGYSLEEAGNKIGISRAVLYKYETNETIRIPLDKIEAIANAYKVTPAYLCNWEKITNKKNYKSRILQFVKDVGQGTITAWSGLTTGFVMALFSGSTAIGGVSAIGIMTLYVFLTYESNEVQKKKYLKKFGKKKLLISLPEIFTENEVYKHFRNNCFFSVGLGKIENWKHKILDLLLKTFFFLAYLEKEDKIDEFIEVNKNLDIFDNDFSEIIEDQETIENNLSIKEKIK